MAEETTQAFIDKENALIIKFVAQARDHLSKQSTAVFDSITETLFTVCNLKSRELYILRKLAACFINSDLTPEKRAEEVEAVGQEYLSFKNQIAQEALDYTNQLEAQRAKAADQVGPRS